MNSFYSKSSAVILLLAGCAVTPLPAKAKLSVADDYRRALIEQLELIGEVEELDDKEARAGNIHTAEYGYRVASDRFPPDRLYEVAKTAKDKWGAYDDYSKHRFGGVGNRFQMHFGHERDYSHTFIEVIAYSQKEWTRVDILIRVID